MDALQALIIDDNRDITLFFSTVLSMEGFHCDIANSAKQALYRLVVAQPDLVLLDMRLRSEIGGEDILYQIRSNPRFDKTQVIVITAYPELVEPVKHLADLVLFKPVEVDQLKGLASRIGSVNLHQKQHYFRDPVTDLYNRQFFINRLDQAVERARRRSDFLFATLFFTFEMAERDQEALDADQRRQVMRQLAERIRRSYRPTDTLARWNGDHFATLHEELKSPDNVNVLTSRLHKELSEPCQVGGRACRLTPRFNAVLSSQQYRSTEDILKAARSSTWDLSAPPPASDY
ncbi:MAG: diguanylate cyclase [Anaerolineales bacterium]|jgi:diguanylate cyclase (GGDEF)-like protein|nr:diguanylate cyclase [Anaerolineales bacterium]